MLDNDFTESLFASKGSNVFQHFICACVKAIGAHSDVPLSVENCQSAIEFPFHFNYSFPKGKGKTQEDVG